MNREICQPFLYRRITYECQNPLLTGWLAGNPETIPETGFQEIPGDDPERDWHLKLATIKGPRTPAALRSKIWDQMSIPRARTVTS